MRIGLFTAGPLTATLGAVKNRLELSAALKPLGWECTLYGFKELGLPQEGNSHEYRLRLRDFLVEHADKFDVVLYEYDSLPFDRKLFSDTTLLVARPALLDYHLDTIKIPTPPLIVFRSRVKRLLTYSKRKRAETEKANNIEMSLVNTDLVQVQNTMDAKVVRARFPGKKVVIIPNGLSKERFAALGAPLSQSPITEREPVIAFVGTFDYRKGAVDMRKLFPEILKSVPSARFKLIGTKALFQSAGQVLNFLPSSIRARVEVIERFKPEALPELLKDCQAGIFPSYWESFGFGALEMMAAGLPVVAYRAPGPCDFIPQGLLVEPGDVGHFQQLVVDLLTDKIMLLQHSENALTIAASYDWKQIASKADQVYREHAPAGP